MRQRERHDHCPRTAHSRLRPTRPPWPAGDPLSVRLRRRRRARRGGGCRPVRPLTRSAGRGPRRGERGRRHIRGRARGHSGRQHRRRSRSRYGRRDPHRCERRPGLARRAATGPPTSVGTARLAVRPRPPGHRPRRAPGHARPRGGSRPGVLHRHGGRPRRPVDHADRHRAATPADHLRTGDRGRRRGRRGDGGPGRGRPRAGTVPLRGRMSALGSAAGRDLSRPVVPAAGRLARPRPGPAAAGVRGPRAGRRAGAARIPVALASRRRGDHDRGDRCHGGGRSAHRGPARDCRVGAPAQSYGGQLPRTPVSTMDTAASAITTGSSAAPNSIRRTAASTTP